MICPYGGKCIEPGRPSDCEANSACVNFSSAKQRGEFDRLQISLVGKHFYCDLHEVVVTVVDEKLLNFNGQIYRSAKGVEVETWWTHPRFPKRFWVKREELEEVELSCPLLGEKS